MVRLKPGFFLCGGSDLDLGFLCEYLFVWLGILTLVNNDASRLPLAEEHLLSHLMKRNKVKDRGVGLAGAPS